MLKMMSTPLHQRITKIMHKRFVQSVFVHDCYSDGFCYTLLCSVDQYWQLPPVICPSLPKLIFPLCWKGKGKRGAEIDVKKEKKCGT